jgi:hypothetical protein
LKRKTEARYFPHSVQGAGFSLNGATRFLGVGSVLGRSVTRTPMSGTTANGHGGGGRCRVSGVKGRQSRCDSNNEYPEHIIRSGELAEQTLVKRSTMNTNPYLELKRMNTLNKVGCHWVKPNGLDDSDLLRISIANTVPAECTDASKLNGCPIKSKGYTKAAPGPLSYAIFYMQKDWQTRACALPSWPPRVNNSACAPRAWPSVSTVPTQPCAKVFFRK